MERFLISIDRERMGTHPDKEHASAGAVRAGTDLECGSEYASLADAVKAGLIDEKEIDISLKRLLTARFELGENGRTTGLVGNSNLCVE